MLDRARTLTTVAHDIGFQARAMVWKNSAVMALKSPFWGIGHGTFERVYRDDYLNVHPHNDYLQLAVSMGIAATVFYVMILIRVLVSIRRASGVAKTQEDRVVLAALAGGFITTMIESFFASLLTYGAFTLVLWYMLGVAAGYSRSIVMDHEEELEARENATPARGIGPPT
jgi:O-antigen ligase